MTRKRVTASEKKQRHEWAVRQIDAGMGLSELTAFTARKEDGRGGPEEPAFFMRNWSYVQSVGGIFEAVATHEFFC